MKFSALDVSQKDVRDAARLAIQSAVAALTVFLTMRALELPEKFVGVLSAVLVVQPSVGSTIGAASDRVLSTLVGSAVGIVCLLLLPDGYGTAVALAVSMLVMNAIAGFRSEWRYGVVAAVALALGSEEAVMETAKMRAIAIGGGVLLGMLATLVVWPESAQKRAKRHLQISLRAAATRLDCAVSATEGQGDDDEPSKARKSFHFNLEGAREAAKGIRIADSDVIRTQIDETEKLYNSILILNRVAQRTDEASGGDEEFREHIDEIREHGCTILRALADEEPDQEDLLERVGKNLKAAQSEVSGADEFDDERIYKGTILFGLSEVEGSLRALVESFPNDPDE